MSQNDLIRSATPPPTSLPSATGESSSTPPPTLQNNDQQNQQQQQQVPQQPQHPQPRRLEPTLNLDGSILTTPLSTVLNSTTDALYNDLHAMTYGELTIARQQINRDPDDEEDEQEITAVTEKKRKNGFTQFCTTSS
mmetsp:Transcript_53813/g.80311  ORF Transcript_53813/g.80311 Transcript_53813/m.80311 type:complete len:137 (+) Transcript_53813:223-633(+)